MQEIKRLLVANRSEIAIRILRAAAELNITTVSIHTHEDRFSPHRYKADESYQIGDESEALKPYLDYEAIVKLAIEKNIDAIHPGYGFLSENVNFVRLCEQHGITFIGPSSTAMDSLGDKIKAKENAVKAGLPIIPNNEIDLTDAATAQQEGDKIGYPLMIKAAAGGGGRGMRVIHEASEIATAFADAKSEALKSFGDDTLFMEKFIDEPKHIEIQILADNFGNIVHLFERDCSVQRRFQKVVEVAPAKCISDECKQKLYTYAIDICKQVDYSCAGTVEFLVDKQENIYFIEVNPRVQVEHTITEEITGIDIVRSQIHIASGIRLSDPEINISSQASVQAHGYAVQCRITTEDPANNFKPDFGTIIAYRSASGFGIRLDAGAAYVGSTISPFYDSMLVKVSAKGRSLDGAIQRAHRALREFRIRGVKTNIDFILNVLEHPEFSSGEARVSFLEKHPDLVTIKRRHDSATKLLAYLSEIMVNGHPDIKHVDDTKVFKPAIVPQYDTQQPRPKGTKDLLNEMGPEKFSQWVLDQKQVLFTDTTLRDAHQSLLATRMRTDDMLKVAEGLSYNHPELFSLEMWGGATFDVALRFLHECPWVRLQKIREAVPNILLQMLFRGSNAVGYKAYPDNVVERFLVESWENGIDVFRIFDSLNWFEGMNQSIKTVRTHTNAIAEATICYTGDVLNTDPSNKYNFNYYLDLAKRLQDAGAHTLALKDMAGLLKPYAANELIPRLKEALDIPLHLHTHDTSSMQAATVLNAIDANVDIVDACLSSMSGLTSQPNLNSIVASLQGHERECPIDLGSLNAYANYWEDVRDLYYPFESGLKSGTAEVYEHEIPGGQYSNLKPQSIALGLENKFELVKKNFSVVNKMVGDIVKVTPSSKVVGDMAIYMTSNGLTEADIMADDGSISFPQSFVELFEGQLGHVDGGFPDALSKIVLKGKAPLQGRPGEHLPSIDFDKEFESFQAQFGSRYSFLDFLSYQMYPAVFEDYHQSKLQYGDVSNIPTKAFFFGIDPHQELSIKLGEGKHIIIKHLYTSAADKNGYRTLTYELNGVARNIKTRDNNATVSLAGNRKATEDHDVGSPIPGKLSSIKVKAGDRVEKDAPLFVIEAMKMETTVTAKNACIIDKVILSEGGLVEQDDLVITITH